MAAVGLSSCRRTAFHDALLRAEALMETDPQQARAVLAEIEDSILKIEDYPAEEAGQKTGKNLQSSIFNFQSKSEASLYAWLKTQADYKCDIPLTSDSLARIATDYYGVPRRKNYHAAMAWYTLGCAYGDMNDDVNATDALLKARSLFPDSLIRYFALTEMKLGIHHLNRHMTREAAQEFQSAKQNLIRLGDSTAVAFLDLSLARCCLYKENYASAKEWLERVLHNPHASQYVFTVAHFEMAKVETYYTHDYAKALEYIDYDIRHTTNKKKLTGTYSLKAATLQEQGSLDSAWHYYHRSLNCQSNPATFSYVYRQMAILAPQLGKADSISYFVRHYHTYIDSLYIISNQQTIRQVTNDHRVEMEKQRLENEHRRLLWKASALLAFFVLAAGIVLLLLDRKRKGERLKYETELRDIKQRYLTQAVRKEELAAEGAPPIPSDNEEPATSSLALQEERKLLYQRQYEASEWARYFKKHQPDIKAKQFVTVADAEQFERYLSGLFVDMLVDMVKENPDLTDEDTLHCAMTLLGFKPSQIAYCSRTSSASCYTRRSRMKPKLTPEWYQFIFGKAAE